jgi:hypothetical protein
MLLEVFWCESVLFEEVFEAEFLLVAILPLLVEG